MRLWLAGACIAIVAAGGPSAAEEGRFPRATSFLTVDGAFDGLFASAGMDLAFGAADGRGPVLRWTAGGGFSRYRIDPALPLRIGETTQSLRLLAGWREVGGFGQVLVYAGLAGEARRLSQPIPDPAVGFRIGPTIGVDAWLTPADRLALHVFASYATPYGAATLKVAPGFDIGGGLFVGPEAIWSAHHGTLRSRFGLHLTGLRILDHGIRLSGGYAADRGGRSGFYAGLAIWRHY